MKAEKQRSIVCNRWTFQTLCCYKYKMHCDYCPNDTVCTLYEGVKNDYNMRTIKYVMLKTYAKLGKPKGYENDTRDEQA